MCVWFGIRFGVIAQVGNLNELSSPECVKKQRKIMNIFYRNIDTDVKNGKIGRTIIVL